MKILELKVRCQNTDDNSTIILNKVLEMVARGDSKETIFEIVEYLRS